MSKAMLAWLAMIWAIFGTWLFIVTPFPLNVGILAWQCFLGSVVSWLMLAGNEGER